MTTRLSMSNVQNIFVITTRVFLLFLLCAPIRASADESRFTHEPPECVVADFLLPIHFTLQGIDSVEEARVYFRAQGAEDFYYVKAEAQDNGDYQSLLPAPESSVEAIEYVLLVVKRDGESVKTPQCSVPLHPPGTCSADHKEELTAPLNVFAQQDSPSGLGFSSQRVLWIFSDAASRETYLEQADEVALTSSSSTNALSSALNNIPLNKKTALAAGAGLGAAGLTAALLGGEEEDTSIWDSVDEVTDSVVTEIIKIPTIQTSCGTVVTNQIFVTNTLAEEIMIGTIDYEIQLTRDQPSGSCALGHSGAFAPNLAATIPPGQQLLIREWSHEVNPCSGCPYVPAECTWESRYVVHTSAGSSVAFATFMSEGDLCAASTAKSGTRGATVKGDFHP